MPYHLRLKIYTNDNLEEGQVVVPEEPVSGGPAPLLHCNPSDYIKILKIIGEYFNDAKEKRANTNSDTQDGSEAQASTSDST